MGKIILFLSASSLQKLETLGSEQPYQVNKKTVSRHIQKSQHTLGSSKRKIHTTDVRPMASVMFH